MNMLKNVLMASIPVFIALYTISAIQKKSIKIWE